MKKLIVISADALVTEDLSYLYTLPNYQKYLSGGCQVEKVRSIYPTITYPCHTTMITGVYPDKHRVTGNLEFHPGQSSNLPWLWDCKWNQWKEDIFMQAQKAGYRTAAVFWPVTGNHPYIDDLIAEYWVQSESDTPSQAYRRMGSNEQMISIIEKNTRMNGKLPHPQIDQFIIDCACDVLRESRPDVLFVHPADIDAARHEYGNFNDKVKAAIENTDRYIGQIMRTVEDLDMLEEMNLVLTSDHGQLNINRILNLNVLFAEKGFIHIDESGNVKDWEVWCLSGGMSANIYLKNPDDQILYQKIYQLLLQMAEDGIYGFGNVYTRAEIKENEHLDGNFSFILETDGYTSFGDAYKRPLVTNLDNRDYRYGKATHGYLPEKGPQPVFLAKGPDFKEHVVLKQARLIDEAPTFAKLLGITLNNIDGRALTELLY